MADESQSRNAMTNSSLLKRNRSALVDITNTITTRSRAAKEQSKVSVATREEVKEILARDDMVMSPKVCDSSLLDDTETTMRNSDLVIAHDQSNRNNTDGCGEYAIEIFEHLINTERRLSPSFNYMEQVQHDINPTMRGILIDWLVEVAEEYKLSSENLFLSTNYVDRFLSVMPVLRSKLQLVGVTCMLIASKYEEILAPPRPQPRTQETPPPL
uniref:Cyclin-like domain-containing protein n=1 Tax=Guillardia theta TaxID=55529 RepID=A0A7S4KIZ1_GUITH